MDALRDMTLGALIIGGKNEQNNAALISSKVESIKSWETFPSNAGINDGKMILKKEGGYYYHLLSPC